MYAAAAAIYSDAVIRIIGTDRTCRFQLVLVSSSTTEFSLNNNVSLFHGFFYIALIQNIVTDDVRGNTFTGILAGNNIQSSNTRPRVGSINLTITTSGERVNDRLRIWIQCLIYICDERKFFILQFNCFDCILCQFQCLCCNDCNRLACPNTFVINRETILLRQTLHMERRTLYSKYLFNARNCFCLADIQLRNLTMCYRAAQNLHVQKTRNELVIVGCIQAFTSCLIICIDTKRGFTNVIIGSFFGSIAHKYYLLSQICYFYYKKSICL